MKRAVIAHCWGGYPGYCWYSSVKQELETKGFKVAVPAFPDTDAPNLQKWLPVLTEVVGEPSQELFLIGHSVGCITILRYLESLQPGQKVGGVVLVAGFTDALKKIDTIEDELQNFFETPIPWEILKTRATKFVAIHSDNDPYVMLKHAEVFKEKLEAEVIVKHNAGHFSGKEDNCTELPDVVEKVLEMANT